MPVSFHSPHIEFPTHPACDGQGSVHPPAPESVRSGGSAEQQPTRIDAPATPEEGSFSPGLRGQSSGAPNSPGLPASYALERNPADYGTTKDPGVFMDQYDGQKFFIESGKAYPVRYDSDNQSWRIVQPAKPTNRGIPVRQNADGSWSTHGEVGGKGGGPADAVHSRAQLQLQKSELQHQVVDAQTQVTMADQEVRTGELYLNVLQQHIRDLENRALPETWGDELASAREEMQRGQQKLQQGRRRLEELRATHQQYVQQLQHVDSQLQQLR
jgi:hypothetical protein